MSGQPRTASIRRQRFGTALVLCVASFIFPLYAQPVPVRYQQGTYHGFLVLSTLQGKPIAHGDLIQVANGNRVTIRLLFNFKDSSQHDETAVYSQRRTFRLLSYHLIQKGPSFPHPLDVSVNCSSGEVTVHSKEKGGADKAETDRLKLPVDLANGLIPTLLTSMAPGSADTTVTFLAATPKPRLLNLVISPEGKDPLSVAGAPRQAIRYRLKMELGGPAGAVATVIGKQPPDAHIWILEEDAPAFVKMEGQLYMDGPVWRIEPASPVWHPQ